MTTSVPLTEKIQHALAMLRAARVGGDPESVEHCEHRLDELLDKYGRERPS